MTFSEQPTSPNSSFTFANMKKDINPPAVKDIAMAVVPELNELNETVYNVYFINLKEQDLEGVLVSSRGYGELNGEKVNTSELRHFLDVVPGKSFRQVEPIIEDVFALSNQYWVSFYENGVMADKKYVFVAGSIDQKNFTEIPLLGIPGVLIS